MAKAHCQKRALPMKSSEIPGRLTQPVDREDGEVDCAEPCGDRVEFGDS
jgi:hypothetical protein